MKTAPAAWTLYLPWAAAFAFLGLALASLYPGVAGDVSFIVALFAIALTPFVVISLIAFAALTIRKELPQATEAEVAEDLDVVAPPSLWWRRRAIPVLLLIFAVVLLATGTPRRLAFRLSRSAFEREVAGAPASFGPRPLDRRLGAYWVDRYAADPRGGVFFRTYKGMDGLGPDAMSHGFAYRPNGEGSPFGRARYSLSHLHGDWYVFAASDD